MVKLTQPAKLTHAHDLTNFNCGTELLDKWLKTTALKKKHSGASTANVVCEQSTQKVVGYFCLSAGSIIRASAPSRISRNQPEPIPVMLLGRLAVDQRLKGIGLGRNLFVAAYQIALQTASIVGIRALMVHAVDEDAKNFWLKLGFRVSPTDPMTLLLKL